MRQEAAAFTRAVHHVEGSCISSLSLALIYPTRVPIPPAVNVTTPNGVRDRAMMEVFYTSGIRRMELVHLTLYDIDTRGGSLAVRGGKGGGVYHL